MPRVILHLSVTVLLFLSAATRAADDTPPKPATIPSSAHSRAEKRQIQGLPNFGEVTPTLFRGAQPTHEGFKTLAGMGIDIVVDARHRVADPEAKEVRQLGMQYVAIPWHCPFPKDDIFLKFLKLLQENPNKKVFLHCGLGEDRTGMMIAAYRMAAQGWTADEAMLEMKQFGFSSVHHVICPGLASYEKHFPDHLRTNPAFADLRRSAEAPPR
jgi:tyrosine-protein phosphatase SIW14